MDPINFVSDSRISEADAITIYPTSEERPLQIWGQESLATITPPHSPPHKIVTLDVTTQSLETLEVFKLLQRVKKLRGSIPRDIMSFYTQLASKFGQS